MWIRSASRSFLIILTAIVLLPIPCICAATGGTLQNALSKVVMIIVMDENRQPLAIGSGFVVGKNGEIATNYHVVEGASSALIKFANQEAKFTPMAIIHKDADKDLAVLKISSPTSPIGLGDDEINSVGQRVFAIGNPEGLEGTVSEGIISGFRKIDDTFRLMQITAPISPGSSGGPVLNGKGEVIGVASGSLISGQNLNFAIPVTELKRLLSRKPVDLPFRRSNLPETKASSPVKMQSEIGLVQVKNVRRESSPYIGYPSDVTFSIQNNSRRDINNIKVVLLWKSTETGEMLHYNPLLVKETVAAGHTKLVRKIRVEGVADLSYQASAEPRIIDYNILPSSGLMEFK